MSAALATSDPEPRIIPMRPSVVLPCGGDNRIIDAARDLGAALAATGRFFTRGDATVTVAHEDDMPILRIVKPAALASHFEEVASLQQLNTNGNLERATCSESTAKLIGHCAQFQAALPPIRLLSRCSVLIERDGELVEVTSYDRDSGVMAGGLPAEKMTIDEAREVLDLMLCDFNFATPSDASRALAALITPALIFGNLLGGRAPVDLGEADDSQAGKGYCNKLKAATYNHEIHSITQSRSGVGGLEEKLSTAFQSGKPFISLDNVRGKIDSPALESLLTEDVFVCRAPYTGNVEIDPRRTVIMMTSNKAEVTRDLANRSSCVRILKHEDGHQFRGFPEGDILDHVRANQPHFLGAVFAVIRAWHEAGKPQLTEVRHDFRRWARVLGWIVENILNAAPLLDGHRETQQRMTNPALTWLRDVALIVKRADKLNHQLRAFEVLDLIDGSDVRIPSFEEGDDLADEAVHKRVLQGIGKEFRKAFRDSETITIDGYTIIRHTGTDDLSRPTKCYEFQKT